MENNSSPSKNSPTKSSSPPPPNPPPSDQINTDTPMDQINTDTPTETNPDHSPMEINTDTPMDINSDAPSNPDLAERTPPAPEPTIKTALEVLAELSAGDDHQLGGNNDGNAAAGGQGGGSGAVAIGGGGSMVIEGGSGGMSNDGQISKRRNVEVRDPPAGPPRCPKCGREFSTWRAAFGHLRSHLERPHRGFFAPPAVNCPLNTFIPEFDDGPAPGVTKDIVSVVRKLVTDLNQSLGKEGGARSTLCAEAGSSKGGIGSSLGAAGSSEGGAGSSQGNAGSKDDRKGKGKVIDLNLPPPPEDDDDEDMGEN